MFRRHFNDDEEESVEGAHKFNWFGNNRLLCDVLSDMRKCVESSNFSPMSGLIEEAQIMGNRMEAALSEQSDLLKLNIEYSKAKKAYNNLKTEYDKIKPKKTSNKIKS